MPSQAASDRAGSHSRDVQMQRANRDLGLNDPRRPHKFGTYNEVANTDDEAVDSESTEANSEHEDTIPDRTSRDSKYQRGREDDRVQLPRKSSSKVSERQNGHIESRLGWRKDKSGATSRAPRELQRRSGIASPASAQGDKNLLKIRLDINLDIEIHLKAKIRGDITLTLF